MICFELSHNGKKVCTAGVENGMLIFNLANHTSAEILDFRMAAVVDHKFADREHIKWADGPANIGDQFTIKVVESDACDPAQPTLLEKTLERKQAGNGRKEMLE